MFPTTLLADSVVCAARARPLVRRPVAASAARLPRVPRWSLARTLAVALAVLVVGGLGYLRAWPPLATVMSASMAPTIKTGDMVVMARLHGPARIGDIVEVSVPDEARSRYGYPPVVIHRVFAISPAGEVRTKGDARPQPDPFTVPRTALNTRVVGHIPAGGRVLAFFHSAPGLLWLLAGGVLFLGLPLLDRQREARREEVDASQDLREQLESVTGELVALRSDLECRSEAPAEAVAAAVAQQLERLLTAPAVTPAIAAPRPVVDPPRTRPGRRIYAVAGGTLVAAPLQPAPVLVAPPQRWDAPPPPSSAGAGWAAFGHPAGTPRFRREPSRFVGAIAASQASASRR